MSSQRLPEIDIGTPLMAFEHDRGDLLIEPSKASHDDDEELQSDSPSRSTTLALLDRPDTRTKKPDTSTQARADYIPLGSMNNGWVLAEGARDTQARKTPQSAQDQGRDHANKKALRASGPAKPIWQRSGSWWWWELLAAFLSIACMSMTFSMLISMQNKSLAEWKLPIQINSLLSVLTTLSKSALMLLIAECIGQLKWIYFENSQNLNELQAFDDASRGPWGAANMLWKTKGKASVAAAGSLITIIALGFEPTAQQVLSFPLRPVVRLNETAWVGAATPKSDNPGYPGKQSFFPAISNETKADYFLPLELRTAFYYGLLAADGEPMYDCSTAACRVPDFGSLGVCSSCALYGRGDSGFDCTERSCQYTFSDREIAPITVDLTQAVDGFSALPDVRTLSPTRCAFVLSSWSTYSNATYAKATGLRIAACSWYWCHRQYSNVSIVNGVLKYGSLEKIPLRPEWNENIFGSSETTFENSTLMIAANSTSVGELKYPLSYYEDWLLWDNIAQLFNTTQERETYTTSLLTLLIRPQDPEKLTEAVSESLTNYMRSTNYTGFQKVTGKALSQETYVHVRWVWLLLPMSLTLLGAILLLTSIFMSERRKHRLPLLKSSALALLFHGLAGFDGSESEKDKLRPPTHPREEDPKKLEKMAKSLRVRLQTDGEGVMKLRRAY